ncbi:MAG: 3-oxoacyl-[acyl-carrier-protein] reductase [Weeksellaceae bacterium]|nr:3-oxoacyl-[acyl-carrier-protein] reductase [Weeksellaceae bacterium]
MQLLEGKVALVTGGTRGIGKGIVEEFVRQGARVAFTYASSSTAAEELEAELGESVKGFKSDAGDFDAAQALVDEIIADFGQIDIVVNNAGITKDNLLMRMTLEDWQKVLQVNLDSAFNLTKAVLRPMLKQRSGSIINMSSIVGLKGNAGQANYSASKAGLIGFSKSVALELGSRNIRCNVIAPGFIETEMTEKLDAAVVEEWRKNIPLKRGGTPQDIAHACVFLGSSMSEYITGQVISVDGGMYT